MRLTFSADSVVVVAGVPGAGKTTLIRRAVDPDAVQVVDTEDLRDARGRAPRLLNLRHYARILAALGRPGPVVVHSRGTHAGLRRGIAALAAAHGRPAHLLLLDADRAAAEAGQRARGRRIAATQMDRQIARWRRMVGRSRALRREGWASVTVLDRAEAAEVAALEFAAEPAAAAAAPLAAA